MPDLLSDDGRKTVQYVLDGVRTALEPIVTGGTLGGRLLAIVVSAVTAGPDQPALELCEDHIAAIPVEQWPEDSYGIARAKTALTVRTGLTAEEVHKYHSELLQPGDVVWWGNTALRLGGTRVVISASGLDEEWDQRICETIADMLRIAFADADPRVEIRA